MTADIASAHKTTVLVVLSCLLIVLLLLLLYFYKRLNRDTDDQYSVQRLVFRPGGLRDRVMQGARAVESRVRDLRSRLQPQDEEEGNYEDNEDGSAGGKKGEADKGHTGDDSMEDDIEGPEENSSDDYSSIDLRERAKQNNTKDEEQNEGEQNEESKDGAGKNESKESEEVTNEERVGLLIDLKSFSGSAIWSEERAESSVTAL
ncbi:uncharacterized protein LOC143475470 [Brachyhypopomus gauderio]|uniref:uncharacterized protein LOC143475470 n=1 Tax=Brachyhypopomus gauderio TaxID=698409 RepID=UPI0040415C47